MSTISALIGIFLTPLPFPGATGRTCKADPTLVANMDGEDSNWHKADDRTNGGMFNAGWRADHAVFNNNYLNLRIDDQSCPIGCSGKPYASGEYRTNHFYGYGTYEARFKAARGDGVVTSFFTYTGPSDGNPQDEIDIEILGKDPTKMQINYFTGGTGKHEVMVNLGFDASAGFHNYAIQWSKDSIVWFADGKKVHTETGSRGPLPTHPGRIMANLWPGIGVDGWLKPFSYSGPIRAQYDWIKYTPAGVCMPVPAKVGPVVPAEIPEQPDLYPGELDPELGEIKAEGVPRLHHLKVKENVTLERLNQVLSALKQAHEIRVVIVDDHQYSSQEFKKLYPELAEIERHDPRLYWYLRDFRAHWDNAILLLSIYTQKIVESTREDKDELLKNALEIAEGFRKRLRYQDLADKASGEKRSPSDYSLALLDLTLAEIYSQTKNRDAGFYEKGIAMATSALHSLLYLEDKEMFPSKPDYFVITKGILILGDLYQQLAHFTTDINQKQKYFEVAFQLYQSVSDLKASESGSLSLYLDWLVVDPLLQKFKSVDLSQPYPAPLGFELTIDRSLVEEALSFNFERGYIKSEDAEKALTGIFHYQKGVAMIKAAGLVAAWPRLKPIAEILYQIENLERGMTEINEAILRTGEDEKKIAFFFAFKKIVEGELLMALADRINFYQDKKAWGELQKNGEINQYIAKAKAKIVEDLWKTLKDNAEVSRYLPETLEELKRSRDPLKSVIPNIKNESLQQKGKDLSRWVELLRGGAAETQREQAELLTAVARDYYFSGIPREYKYLYAWAKVKQLEIAIRNATYVLETKQGKRYADATELLKFCQENKELLTEIAEGKIPREYLNIEFDYLQTILNLASIPVRKNGRFVRERDETGIPRIKRIDLADQIFALNQPVEKDIQSLSPALTEYFKTYTQLKEVGALIQVRKRKKEKNQLILDRIKAKTGRELAPLDYALALLKGIEKRTAPALPPYLLHNLTVTLPERIKKNKDTREIMVVTKLFIEKRIKEYYPAATYEEVKKCFGELEKAVNKKNIKEVEAALETFIGSVAKRKITEIFGKADNSWQQFFVDANQEYLVFKPNIKNEIAAKISDANKKGKLLAILQQSFKAKLTALDASSKYEKKYAELLVWDLHSLRAELYHMLAVVYAIKGAGKPEGSPEGRILTQYAQSAYMESETSNNPYDYKYRRFFIFQGTDSFPDQDIPSLKGIMKRPPRKEKVKF